MNETIENATKENRLKYEKSPYLLQHAENPIHWNSWGEEAFHTAIVEDKPVFLSIGYSTCHWCHVMGRESFEDEEVARVLNRGFVSIKVDREERPDVDGVYMAACQALTGSGGWPLTILMTPDQKPFWAGTYLPPRSGGGRLGLVELLEEIERLWQSDRSRLLELGQQAARELGRREAHSGAQPDRALLRQAASRLRQDFDRENGGFGGAPKFPSPHTLLFLLDRARREGDLGSLEMAETTLVQMARGGIFDQLNGGFCRYSTDDRWQVPHFEKMLYDNALLSCAYLEAYAQTGRPYYRETACRTLDYALRELRLPGGGFACGQDADSGGEEGKFYLLTRTDVEEVLGVGEAAAFCHRFAVAGTESVPHLLEDSRYETAWREHGEQCRRLAAFRRHRTALHRDDKVVVSWNAMMISALAKAYRVLGEVRYLRAAESARLFLKTRLARPDGRLYLRWRDREAAVEGQLDDYAFYCWALLELYEANFSTSCLREAVKLADKMEELFWDGEGGGFFRTAADGERLIVRQKEVWDSGVPSGNAAAALALVRLAQLTAESRFRARAGEQLNWLAGELRRYPVGGCFALLAMAEALYPVRELVCASSGSAPAWLAGAGEAYRLTVLAKTAENSRGLARLAPYTESVPIPDAGEKLYLCRDGACLPPADGPGDLRRRLAEDPVASSFS
ncbi:MAG: thioredoxin domain-containing protein [Oscillospiraceae bacterium]|nr:thioredoxin domain-containing protein [Oscillospiraceae bacterium]